MSDTPMTDERLAEIERMHDGFGYEETTCCQSWKVVTELVAEVRRLRAENAALIEEKNRPVFGTLPPEFTRRAREAREKVHIKLPPIGATGSTAAPAHPFRPWYCSACNRTIEHGGHHDCKGGTAPGPAIG